MGRKFIKGGRFECRGSNFSEVDSGMRRESIALYYSAGESPFTRPITWYIELSIPGVHDRNFSAADLGNRSLRRNS